MSDLVVREEVWGGEVKDPWGGGHKSVNVVAEWEAFWGRTSIRAIRAVRREKWGGCDERWDSERRGRPPYPVNQRMSEWGGIEYRLVYLGCLGTIGDLPRLNSEGAGGIRLSESNVRRLSLHGTGLELSNQRATAEPPIGASDGRSQSQATSL